MKRTQLITMACLSSVISVHMAGCGNKFFDPTQVGRFRAAPAVNVILDSLGVAEETPVPWKQAEDPRPSDIVAVETDYVFRSGDVIRIAVFELFQEGTTVVSDYIVTETGKISIPDVGVIQAGGFTERQLEDEIKRILSPAILKDPSVTVTLLSSQQRTFTVLGDGVPRPSRYVIPRYDFRLTDALATAGGPAQFNVSYIYVSRREQSEAQMPEATEAPVGQPDLGRLETVGPEPRPRTVRTPVRPGAVSPRPTVPPSQLPARPGVPATDEQKLRLQLEREMLEMITPQAGHRWPETKKVVIASTEMAGQIGTGYVPDTSARLMGSAMMTAQPGRSGMVPEIEWIFRDGKWIPLQTSRAAPPRTAVPQTRELAAAPQVEWIFRDGKWIPIEAMPPRSTVPEIRQPEPSSQVEWIFQDGRWVPIQVTPPRPPKPETKETEGGGRIEWIFEDGKWVPIQVGPPRPTKPAIEYQPKGAIPLEEKIVEELEWPEAIPGRLIRIPAAKLLAGDPRYNIVIKPGDSIHVPVDIIGEFCIMGNVNRRGYINITGRPMTLKMAIAAAGGLGPLAWPKRCEVIRRIGENKEEIVMVDLDKIAMGEQPDFFIKPNDLINVGTHATARWRAILRNAFRATYGFGFVYDRNFAYQDYYGTTFNRIWPWDWHNVF